MKTLLVTFDFSKNAMVALRYAIRLSQLLKCKLVVFHCTYQSPHIIIKGRTEAEREKIVSLDEKDKTELLRKKVLEAYKYIGLKNIPKNTTAFAQFNPLFIEKTIEVAKFYNAGLIIMGTHGASGLDKYLFGSNTSVMIAKSDIPVLAIPVSYRYKRIRKLLYCSDLENISSELIQILTFAKPLKAAINILHFDYGTDHENLLSKKVEKTIIGGGYKNISLIKQKANNKTLINQIKDFLQSHPHEWLVMVRKNRTFWDRLFSGSKTVELSMKLTLPLLSMKK